MRSLMRKIISARERRFVAIAKDEATCRGYKKYAPITKGPWINSFLILLTVLVMPFYITWRLLLRIYDKIMIRKTRMG